MAEDTKKVVASPAADAPSPEQVAQALKEYESETDRVRVLKRYPWLAKVLNTPKPK